MHSTWTHQDFGGKLPSEVFREHFLTCFISDKVGVKLRNMIGIDNICWEADYPHSDSMWPGAPEELWEVLSENNVPDDEIKKMSYQNAMRWYSFDPFSHITEAQATVGALRKAAEGHDVSIQALVEAQSRSAPLRGLRRQRQGTDRQQGLTRSPVLNPSRWLELIKGDFVVAGGGMNFELTDDQELIRKSVAELASKFDDHYWMEKDQAHEFPQEFYDAIADGGWLGMTIPEEYGGHGLGITEATLLLEEVAGPACGHERRQRHSPVDLRHAAGRQARLRRIEGQDAPADRRPAICTSASASPNPVRALTPRASRRSPSATATRTRINGRKVWISKALESEKILLLTRTTPLRRGHQEDRRHDAVPHRPRSRPRRHPADPQDGPQRRQLQRGLHRRSDRPGRGSSRRGGQGFKYILDGLNPERMLIAAEALGIGRVALEKAVKYGNERVVFDRPIGMNQGLQFPLADSLARLDAAELVLRKATWLYDNGKPCGREANTAKYLCADAGFAAADRALQLHGGMGYSEEYHVSRYFREARLMKIAPVSQEMILNFLGEHVLGMPRSY